MAGQKWGNKMYNLLSLSSQQPEHTFRGPQNDQLGKGRKGPRGQHRLGQVRLGQVRLGQVRLGTYYSFLQFQKIIFDSFYTLDFRAIYSAQVCQHLKKQCFYCKFFFLESTRDTRHLQSLQVRGIFHRYLELRECKPRLSKLRSILAEKTYAGPKSVETDGPTMSQLLDRVQCSQKELDQGNP